ncbi:PucR family transcriptional regulator [Sporolactobacillus sp. THM7-4]|nr:PucR family transcriptional regulator [Sporolactobacillus sp. THM7-4]
MSVTIKDLLKLSCLEDATIEAGISGLENIVSTISVLEISQPTNIQGLFFEKNKVFLGGELVITGFASIKDDISAQCESIRRIHDAGDAGMIIYYVGIILPKINQKVIDTANALNFPIICMPKNRIDLRYSEVISDVMELIFNDQKQQKYFVGEMLERISHMQVSQRKIENILRMISDRIRCTVIVMDRKYEILYEAAWPMSATDYLKEVIQVYKSNNNYGIQQVTLDNGREVYINSTSILSDRQITLHIFLISDRKIYQEQMDQSAEVVRLFINIWNNQEGNVGTSELVHAMIKDEPIKMRRLADIMHIDVASIHTIWIIIERNKASSHDKHESENLSLLYQVKEYFEQQSIHYIADIFENRVIVFFEDLKFMDQLYPLGEAFIKDINSTDDQFLLFYQTGLENLTQVRNLYTLLSNHIKDAEAIYPRKTILTGKELQFVESCAKTIEQGEEKALETIRPIMPILADDNGQALLLTLAVYLLDVQMSVVDTAKLMFIHRNTVKYRLRKINELLDYNTRKMPEAFWLYRAVATKRMLDKDLN